VITQGRTRPGVYRESAEVCVIGSGAGGAVVAAELAAAGREVVLLEQGGYHTPNDFDQREEHMLPMLFENAGMSTTEDGAVGILHGRCVGGSTVHNLAYCFRAPDPILALWEEEHEVRDLASLQDSFERVERALGVQQIIPEEVNLLNRKLQLGAERLGYHGLVAKHNRIGCVRSGFCILGCAYGSKQSMLVTYIPRADRAGARIWADCRADRIEASAPGRRRIGATLLDARGRAHGEMEVEASIVVCCAGAIATPLLLEASGLGNSSGQRGRNLHLHPSVIAGGIFEEPLHAYYGIPQSYYIDEFIDLEHDPRSGHILMPIAGFPVLTASTLPGFGRELFGHLRDLPRLGGLLALLHDQSSGSVERGSGNRPRIRYRLTDEDRHELMRGLQHTVEVLWASGAEQVIVAYAQDPLVLRPEDGTAEIEQRGAREGAIPLTSTHPQSTCRMGGDGKTSVVNSWGELHDTQGIFVADMSVFPTSLGAPPQITTAALADRTAQHILQRSPELRT
jgi:choline dehydrogenase-like flavoprotein